MRLVQHSARPGCARAGGDGGTRTQLLRPVEDLGFWNACGIVRGVWNCTRGIALVIELPGKLLHVAQHRASERIHQQLGGVEALSAWRRIGSIGAVAIELASTQPRDKTVPSAFGTGVQVVARYFMHTQRVIQAQLHALGVARIDGKVHPFAPTLDDAVRTHRPWPPHRAPAHRRKSTGRNQHGALGVNHRTPRGGRLSTTEWACPWLGIGCATTAPQLPMSLPP